MPSPRGESPWPPRHSFSPASAGLHRQSRHLHHRHRLSLGCAAALGAAGFVSPTLATTRYEEDIRRVEISGAEIASCCAAPWLMSDRRLAVYVRLLAVETGARRGEVRERRWHDVNLEGRSITVLDTKTDKAACLFGGHGTVDAPGVAQAQPRSPCSRGGARTIQLNYRCAWKNWPRPSGGRPAPARSTSSPGGQFLKSGTTLGVAARETSAFQPDPAAPLSPAWKVQALRRRRHRGDEFHHEAEQWLAQAPDAGSA